MTFLQDASVNIDPGQSKKPSRFNSLPKKIWKRPKSKAMLAKPIPSLPIPLSRHKPAKSGGKDAASCQQEDVWESLRNKGFVLKGSFTGNSSSDSPNNSPFMLSPHKFESPSSFLPAVHITHESKTDFTSFQPLVSEECSSETIRRESTWTVPRSLTPVSFVSANDFEQISETLATPVQSPKPLRQNSLSRSFMNYSWAPKPKETPPLTLKHPQRRLLAPADHQHRISTRSDSTVSMDLQVVMARQLLRETSFNTDQDLFRALEEESGDENSSEDEPFVSLEGRLADLKAAKATVRKHSEDYVPVVDMVFSDYDYLSEPEAHKAAPRPPLVIRTSTQSVISMHTPSIYATPTASVASTPKISTPRIVLSQSRIPRSPPRSTSEAPKSHRSSFSTSSIPSPSRLPRIVLVPSASHSPSASHRKTASVPNAISTFFGWNR